MAKLHDFLHFPGTFGPICRATAHLLSQKCIMCVKLKWDLRKFMHYYETFAIIPHVVTQGLPQISMILRLFIRISNKCTHFLPLFTHLYVFFWILYDKSHFLVDFSIVKHRKGVPPRIHQNWPASIRKTPHFKQETDAHIF